MCDCFGKSHRVQPSDGNPYKPKDSSSAKAEAQVSKLSIPQPDSRSDPQGISSERAASQSRMPSGRSSARGDRGDDDDRGTIRISGRAVPLSARNIVPEDEGAKLPIAGIFAIREISEIEDDAES